MNSLRDVKLSEFQKALDDGQVRMLQILQGAIGFGVFMFLVIVVYMHFMNLVPLETDVTGDETLIQIMTLVHLALLGGAYYGGGLIFNAAFSDKSLAEAVHRAFRDARGGEVTDGPSKCIYVIRNAMITRLAIFEAPALFGLVICLLATFRGVLHAAPVYWINAASAVALLLFIGRTFPGRPSIEHLFEERFTTPGVMN